MNENDLKGKASDHLANERTFLAWIRTSIGIMAFGFVVVKFSLFVKQVSLMIGKDYVARPRGYSALIGIFLVAVGAATTILSYVRYKTTQRQLEAGQYFSSSLLLSLLTSLIFLMSVLLIYYLVITA